MRITRYRGLDANDFDLVVWRYLAFPKFISLLTYQALWFAKLNTLQDQYEGGIPPLVEESMRKQGEEWKATFDAPEYHRQIDNWPTDNVRYGRELTVANCWFLGEQDTWRMWDEYAGTSEGVAIRSTIRKLATHVYAPADPSISQIGRVTYVPFETHRMPVHLAHQAPERAFIKDQRFAHEKEIRIITLSIKTSCCISMKGVPYSPEELSGKHMNNPENQGLYIIADVKRLIDGIVLSPRAPEWFMNLVQRIVELCALGVPVTKSSCTES